MKHLPNICTLANMFFGCLAIAFILNAPSFLTTVSGEDYRPVLGMEQMYLGSFCILVAAFMDVMDGLAARSLGVQSLLGRDLDSLADVVSFGVAPSMILYKFLWLAYMAEPGALDTPVLVTVPAFLIACFGALRLARFNQTATVQKSYFTGMPIPAAGIMAASLPLTAWFPSAWDMRPLLYNRWFLYTLIVALCFLMVSKIKFLKWRASGKGMAAWWPQILTIAVVAAGAPFLKFVVIPVAFVVYIICSLAYRYPNAPEPTATEQAAAA
ncbi:MAG: CDP-alcohol phosphatidyltransferase family protein [Edaphocola sp.]